MKLKAEITVCLDSGTYEVEFSDNAAAVGDPRRLSEADVPKAIAVVRCVLDCLEAGAEQPSRDCPN